MLVAWELPEEKQFPLIMSNLPKATKFASLWATKDVERVKESKIFLVLMEASIHVAIKCKPRLSPTVYEQLSGYAKFKADFHYISI